jgi:hypothetical protein
MIRLPAPERRTPDSQQPRELPLVEAEALSFLENVISKRRGVVGEGRANPPVAC